MLASMRYQSARFSRLDPEFKVNRGYNLGVTNSKLLATEDMSKNKLIK